MYVAYYLVCEVGMDANGVFSMAARTNTKALRTLRTRAAVMTMMRMVKEEKMPGTMRVVHLHQNTP